MEKLSIFLRDLSKETGNAKEATRMIVAVNGDGDEGPINSEGLFSDFVAKVGALRKIPGPNDCDIYIGCWGQLTVKIPAAFLELVAKNRWNVTLDVDD